MRLSHPLGAGENISRLSHANLMNDIVQFCIFKRQRSAYLFLIETTDEAGAIEMKDN
jgi:hypothetical protein